MRELSITKGRACVRVYGTSLKARQAGRLVKYRQNTVTHLQLKIDLTFPPPLSHCYIHDVIVHFLTNSDDSTQREGGRGGLVTSEYSSNHSRAELMTKGATVHPSTNGSHLPSIPFLSSHPLFFSPHPLSRLSPILYPPFLPPLFTPPFPLLFPSPIPLFMGLWRQWCLPSSNPLPSRFSNRSFILHSLVVAIYRN